MNQQTIEQTAVVQDPLIPLERDLRKAAETLSDLEARYLVDYYYQVQNGRIRAGNQIQAQEQEPHELVVWLAENTRRLENNIKLALGIYAKASPVGRWSLSVCGIGPVISAGLLSHIDMATGKIVRLPDGEPLMTKDQNGKDVKVRDRINTVGVIWRFAGLDPTVAWGKKEKRPWNAQLKTLCWKIGESFVKVSGRESDFYGKIWAARKAIEEAKNERGENAAQAEEKLKKFRIGKSTDAYKSYSKGRLPPGHIHARAKRYAVKLFLSHWHYVAYSEMYGEPPPKPYVIEHLGHADLQGPPGYS